MDVKFKSLKINKVKILSQVYDVTEVDIVDAGDGKSQLGQIYYAPQFIEIARYKRFNNKNHLMAFEEKRLILIHEIVHGFTQSDISAELESLTEQQVSSLSQLFCTLLVDNPKIVKLFLE